MFFGLFPNTAEPDRDIWCEPPQSSPMPTPTGALEETHSGKVNKATAVTTKFSSNVCHLFFRWVTLFPGEGDLRERLKRVLQDITQKLEDPEFSQSIASFVKAYETVKADGEIAAALSSFGQPFRAEVRGCKRQRGFEPTGVQLTAVLRSDTCLDGDGGVIIGRPSKLSKQEHVYVTAVGNPSPELHAIIQCVEESVCLEGNQLEIHTLPL